MIGKSTEGRKYIMTKIIFATGNKDKLREIKEILQTVKWISVQ